MPIGSILGRMPGLAGGAAGAAGAPGAGGLSASRVTASRQQYQTTGRSSFTSPRTSLELFPVPRQAASSEQPRLLVAPRASASAALQLQDTFSVFQSEFFTSGQQPRALQPVQEVVVSSAHQQLAGSLPEQLSRLQDPSLPVSLPPLGSVAPSALDNWKLDKLVSALGRNRATWRRCLHLYEWLKDTGHQLDDRLCTTLIRVCADHGDSLAALGVYEWMRSSRSAGGAGLAPTTYTYTAAMRAALAVGLLDRAMGVWDDAAGAGLVPDCRLCITYIETCTRLHLTDKALAMYATMRDAASGSPMAPSVHAFTAAMRAATEGGRWYHALNIWEDMKQAGCAASGHAYAAVISACACGSDWLRAVSLFEDMTAGGISPDVVSCTALITALAAAGEADRAEQVLCWMLTVGLKPNVRTYTALLTAMGNAKQWTRAVELLWAMQQPKWGGIQPNAYTYSALLKSLGEHGQWQLAEAVFSHLEAQLLGDLQRGGAGVVVSTLTPDGAELALALHRAVAGATGQPLSLMPSSPQQRLQPQQPIGTRQVASGHSDGAGGTLQSRQALPNWTSPAHLNGLSVDLAAAGQQQQQASVEAVSTLRSSFSLFSSAADDARSMQRGGAAAYGGRSSQQDTTPAAAFAQDEEYSMFSSSQRATPNPPRANSPILQTFAQISASLGDQLSQISVSAAMSSSLYGSTAPSGSSSASVATAGGQRAGGGGSRGTMPASARPENRIVNEVVCGALMLAYERAGKWQEAVDVLSRALALGIKPNTVMFNTAISAAGKAGELVVAERLFGLAPTPDAVTYETLIAAYGMAALPHKAEGMLRSMLGNGVRPRDFAYCGLIAAHSLAGDWEGALRVRKLLRRDGVAATTHVYNALIAACERAGQYETALELHNSMRRERLEPNAVTQQLMAAVGRQGATGVEAAQVAAAALSAAFAAAGALVMQTGAF